MSVKYIMTKAEFYKNVGLLVKGADIRPGLSIRPT